MAMATATPGSTASTKNVVRGRVIAVEKGPSEADAKRENPGFTGNLIAVLYDVDLPEELRSGEEAEDRLKEALQDFPGPLSDSLGLIGDRLGAVRLANNGSFEIPYDDADFRVRKQGEKRPDLILIIQAPEREGALMKELVVFRTPELRRNAARLEEYFVQIPQEALDNLHLDAAEIGETVSSGESERQAIDRATNRARVIAAPGNAQIVERHDKAKVIKANLLAAASSPQVASAGGSRLTSVSSYAADKDIATVALDHYPTQVDAINGLIDAAGPSADDDQTGRGMPVQFVLNDDDRADLEALAAAGTMVSLSSGDPAQKVLMDRLRAKMNAAGGDNLILTTDNPVIRDCLAREQKQRTIDDIVAPPTPTVTPTPPTTTTDPGASSADDDLELTNARIDVLLARLANSIAGDPPSAALDGTADPASLAAKRASQTTANSGINKLSLSKGPASQTSYYDFSVLNIAFGHIWKQLIDERPATLAATIATHMEEGGHNFANLTSPLKIHNHVFTLFDLAEAPAEVCAAFDITTPEWLALGSAKQSQIRQFAQGIALANAGSANFPNGHLDTRYISIGTIDLPVPEMRPPGNYPVSVGEAEQIKADLQAQGEMLLDSVRSTNVRSLNGMLKELDEALKSKHAFTIFGADETAKAVNFGLFNTYRQRWEPVSYQVGDLIRTVPMSPKESRTFNVKRVENVKSIDKEARKYNSTLANETSSTGRVEEDVVAKAQKNLKFDVSASYSGHGFTVSSNLGIDAHRESEQTRKQFRESVRKATQELKEERSLDISVESGTEYESQESGTISNPNDEIAVTYLFYELQKRFKVSEQLYRTMPVVMVAQDVPDPAEITEAWIVANDWVINRVLLDDSFRAALMYIAQKDVGDDFVIRELRKNLRLQRKTVDRLKAELAGLRAAADSRYSALERATSTRISEEFDQRHPEKYIDRYGIFPIIRKRYRTELDPETAKALEAAARDAHEAAVEKAENTATTLQRELQQLTQVTDDFAKAYREHLDDIAAVTRLKLHIKNNLIYYLQAIWRYEYEDQQYMRLLGTAVPSLEIDTMELSIDLEPIDDFFAPFRADDETLHRAWVKPKLKVGTMDHPIEEVADLGNLLGFMGNYMIFPMKKHNALTEFMVMPYVDASFGAMDPDQLSNISLDEFERYVRNLRGRLSDTAFQALKTTLQAWLELLLADPLRNGDEMIVPTGSLYIEVMASENTLMETFKLDHRQIDVEKARAEVMAQSIDNLRKIKRVLNSELEDPDIEKVINVIGAGSNPIVVDDN